MSFPSSCTDHLATCCFKFMVVYEHGINVFSTAYLMTTVITTYTMQVRSCGSNVVKAYCA